jgi:FkbM family methyltransferase
MPSRFPIRKSRMTQRKIHQFSIGVKFYDDHLIPVQRERYKRLNVHEAEEEEIFIHLIQAIPAEGCFVNIGAAIGYYPILAKLLVPTLTIYAIEPLQRHRKFFDENVILNGFSPADFIIYKEAIASSEGMAMFVDNGYGSKVIVANKQNDRLSSSIKSLLKTLLVQSGIRKSGKVSKPVPVKTITLDSLVSRISRPVDLVQMDVQGLEADVLQGASHSSRTGKIRTFLIGTHGRKSHQKCADILGEYGYVIEFAEGDPKEQPDGIIVASKGAVMLEQRQKVTARHVKSRQCEPQR